MPLSEPIRLITFPFAGGNKYSYQPWEAHADSRIEMLHFEGPGHGDRFRETRLEDMADVIEDYWRQVNGFLDKPYAFYGHSMGGMVSYLLTKRAIKEGYRAPEHVFISGRVPPTWPDEGDQLWQRDKTGFWEGIKAYGGSPEALLKHPDLMDLYEPMIRSDLKSLYSYSHTDKTKIDPPVTVLLGTREKITMESAQDWQIECAQPIQIFQFEGNHFWILDHIPAIMEIIRDSVFGK
jgi:surfactin synthase thioesterase subunit